MVTTEHNTEWAFGLFRPLLKDLQLQSPNSKRYIRTSQKKYGFVKCNMGRCVVVIMHYCFTNPKDKGVFVWTFDKARNFYVLYIIINENLYAENKVHEDCVRRKIVTTHEFTHCVAAMLSLSRISSEQLVESLQKSMRKSIDVIQSVDVDVVMSEFSKEMSAGLQGGKTYLSFRKFDDEHFRTKYEDFDGSYYDLNTNFLLSKQLFEEYFTKDARKEFNKHMKNNNPQKAVALLRIAAEDVINKKFLNKEFVMNRIANDFMPVYLNDVATFIKSNK